MTRGASESREPGLGLIGRLKRRIGESLNLFSGPEPVSPPSPEPDPERTLSVSPGPIRNPVEAPPAPCIEREASPIPGHTQIYETFRKNIIDLGFVLRGVEEDMLDLCKSYLESMPPTRLRLCPWHVPKSPLPCAIYWVELHRKKEEVCDESLQVKAKKGKRWYKHQKIRAWRDLHALIHWNGLDAHRNLVHRFYDAACSLNKAHHTLALRACALVKIFKRNSGGVREVPGHAPMPLEDPAYDHLNRSGLQLLECAWRMQWVVEKDMDRLNELLSQAGFPTLRLRMGEPREGGAFVSFFWDEAERRPGHSPGADSGAYERNELMKRLGDRIGLVRVALSRLEEMAATAESDLAVWKAEAPSLLPSGRSPLVGEKRSKRASSW